LVSTYKTYDVSPVEMLIVPNPLPLDFDLPPAPGWGFAESEHGQGRGAGIEPRGIREYVSGDSLRFVHWRSSARAGRLLVKEFATGTHSTIAFVFQRTRGTEIGTGATTTLEQMCANAAYMTEKLIRQGAEVSFPTLHERDDRASSEDRHQQVLATLAEIEANLPETIGEELATARGLMPSGGLVYLFVGVQDTSLPYEIQRCSAGNIQVVVMAYDALQYLPPKNQARVPSAADKDYVAVLEEAGARVLTVGRPEAL
jgi:uncharacterized protein (DUF58 family)